MIETLLKNIFQNFDSLIFELFKNLHLFYFGRYWNEIETIIDLNQLNCMGKEVNLSGWFGLSIETL